MNDPQNSNPLLKNSISGGLDIVGNYVDAFSSDYSQDVPSSGSGFGSDRDISAIRNQEFDAGEGFNAGTIASGVGAGSAFGPIGMIAGGLLGAGSEIIKMGRRKRAEREFNMNKQRELKDAMYVNSSRNYRGNVRNTLTRSAINQSNAYNRFI